MMEALDVNFMDATEEAPQRNDLTTGSLCEPTGVIMRSTTPPWYNAELSHDSQHQERVNHDSLYLNIHVTVDKVVYSSLTLSSHTPVAQDSMAHEDPCVGVRSGRHPVEMRPSSGLACSVISDKRCPLCSWVPELGLETVHNGPLSRFVSVFSSEPSAAEHVPESSARVCHECHKRYLASNGEADEAMVSDSEHKRALVSDNGLSKHMVVSLQPLNGKCYEESSSSSSILNNPPAQSDKAVSYSVHLPSDVSFNVCMLSLPKNPMVPETLVLDHFMTSVSRLPFPKDHNSNEVYCSPSVACIPEQQANLQTLDPAATSNSASICIPTAPPKESLIFKELSKLALEDELIDRIDHSAKYADDVFEYRFVILPLSHPFLYMHLSIGSCYEKMLSEPEWRLLGIRQTRGWEHIGYSSYEPNILLFRRPLGTDPRTGKLLYENETGRAKHTEMLLELEKCVEYLETSPIRKRNQFFDHREEELCDMYSTMTSFRHYFNKSSNNGSSITFDLPAAQPKELKEPSAAVTKAEQRAQFAQHIDNFYSSLYAPSSVL